MLSLSKLVPGLGSAVNCALRNQARSIYSANYLGIENFKSYSQRFQKENAQNSNTVKQTVKDAVSKPDGKIFTEDLKSYLYQTQTDEEIDTLIEGIKKHQNQQSVSLFSFNFDGPLMRLLYSLNKTDKALSLYLKDNSNFFNKSFKVTAMLMNKLIEEKRFDEALKVGDSYFKHHKSVKQSAAADSKEAQLNLGNILRLYSEALLGKNDSGALKQAKQFLKDVSELKERLLDKSIAHVILLALEQKDPEFAFELLNQISIAMQKDLKGNLKILTLIELKRADEALNLAEEMSKQKQSEQQQQVGALKRVQSIFFRSTLEKLQSAVESNAEKKSRVQTLFDTTTTRNEFFKTDIKEFFTQVIDKRPFNPQQQGARGGNQNRAPNQRFNNENRQPFQQRQQGQQFNRQFNNERRPQQQDRPRFQNRDQQQQKQQNRTNA